MMIKPKPRKGKSLKIKTILEKMISTKVVVCDVR